MAVLKKKTERPRKGETPLSLPFIHKFTASAPVCEKISVFLRIPTLALPKSGEVEGIHPPLSPLPRTPLRGTVYAAVFRLSSPVFPKNGLDSPVFRCHNRAKDRGAPGLRGSKRFDPFT